jgi:putative transposase
VERFVTWYNNEHHHSEISFVTPSSKHHGLDLEILKNRAEIYEQARAKNPLRWSKTTRRWNQITEVHLNPTKETRQSLQNVAKTAA